MSETEGTTPAPKSATPEIICPPWCVVDAAAHVADLENQEGRCIHTSANNEDGWGLGAVTHPDGRIWADEFSSDVEVWDGGEFLTLDEAARLGRAILELVAEAKATPLTREEIDEIRQHAIDRGL